MNLEARARSAAEALRAGTPPDVESSLRALHLTRRRRTATASVLVVALVAAGAALVGAQRMQQQTVPISPTDVWVLATGDHDVRTMRPVEPGCREADPGSVADLDDPDVCGGRINARYDATWAEPLSRPGMRSYEHFEDVDPATSRFLVKDAALTGYLVMTPGRAEPLAAIPCRRDSRPRACWGASLGPGPDEVTVNDDHLLVIGHDGEVRRDLGAWWEPAPANPYLSVPVWAPDGGAWIEVRASATAEGADLSVVLSRPGSRVTLLSDREQAPGWYAPDPRGQSELSGWGSPQVVDAEWSPDSTRVAFMTTSSAGGGDEPRHEVRLYTAGLDGGTAELLAKLGGAPASPLGSTTRPTAWRCACDHSLPDHWLPDSSLAWTPDGTRVTVLLNSTLTTYDIESGEADTAQPTDITGPIAWLRTP